MPSSVRDGTRPRAFRMRWYSSAVMLCWASNSGVTATGSGTEAEEAVVITVTSIVAWHSHSVADEREGEAVTSGDRLRSVRPRIRALASNEALCDTLKAHPPLPGWRNWQTQRTQNPSKATSWGFNS